MGMISSFVGGIIFTAIQAIVFLFVLVATPTSQFNARGGGGCFTLWGYKLDCGSTKYNARGTAAFGCGHRRNNMNGGAAFAIFSIFTTLVALIFGVLMICRIPCSFIIPLVFTILSVATILVSWACVAGVYTTNMCSGTLSYGKFSSWTTYGAGFGLMVTAWCLEVIAVVVLLVVHCL